MNTLETAEKVKEFFLNSINGIRSVGIGVGIGQEEGKEDYKVFVWRTDNTYYLPEVIDGIKIEYTTCEDKISKQIGEI